MQTSTAAAALLCQQVQIIFISSLGALHLKNHTQATKIKLLLPKLSIFVHYHVFLIK